MSKETPNFFDARTIVTIALMGFVFIAWQSYLQKKYPGAYHKKAASVEAPAAAPSLPVPSASSATPPQETETQPGVPDASISAPSTEKLTPYKSGTIAFSLSSKGMGIKDFQVLQYKDRKGDVVVMGHSENGQLPLETRLLGRAEALDFDIEKVNDNLFVGHAQIGGLKITKTVEVVPDRYLLQYRIATSGQDPRFVGLTTSLLEEMDSPKKGTFLLPQLEKQEFYVETAETHDRLAFKKDDVHKSWSKVRVASIGSQYFTQAVVDHSPVMPEAKGDLSQQKEAAQLVLQYPVLSPGQDFLLEYSAYLGPKSFGLLRQIDPSLAKVVDFGFFSWIARYIFAVMQWFHALVGNWGLAIICLTLVVRLFVLPLNIYSYRSMKAMQAIQPQIAAMKERYKDDQQKQQTEMMRLMKDNKVNPLGGCLPMFLQFPVFVALYQVVGHSIELYQAPFVWWIHDLSLKDPYYILPVFMGVTMFIQQKTTPNATMDPAQAKVMMMMPLVFTFFMSSLPSGLTLYMLIGALFSVVQQTYFMRSKKTLSIVTT